MLTFNLARVAVIIAGIAICVYSGEAIYIKLIQTSLACTVLFLIFKCYRYFQRQHEQKGEMKFVKEQETVSSRNDPDFVQKEDEQRSVEGVLPSDQIINNGHSSESKELTRQYEKLLHVEGDDTQKEENNTIQEDKSISEENSSDYYEDIKHLIVAQREPKTKTTENDMIKEEPKRKREEDDMIQKEPKTNKKEEDTIQEEPKTTTKKADTIQANPKLTEEEEDTLQEVSKTTEEEADMIQAKPKTTEKEEDMIQAKPKTTEKEEDMLQEVPTTTEEEADTIQANQKTTEKEEDMIQEVPTTTEEEADMIRANPKTTEKEEDMLQEVPITTEKEENIIQANPKTMAKKEDTLQEVPKTTEEEADTIQANPNTTEKEEDMLQEVPTTTEEEADTIQANPKTTEKEEDMLQEVPTTTEKEADTIQANPKSIEKETDTIQANPKLTEGEEDTLQEVPKTREKEADMIHANPKLTKKEAYMIHEVPKTTEKEAEAIPANRKTTEKEADAIQEVPTTKKKETNMIREIRKATEKESDTIQAKYKTTDKEEDTLQDIPKTTEKEAYMIQEEQRMHKKEVEMIKPEPKTVRKEDDTIQGESNKKKKDNDSIQTEPRAMKKDEDTIQKDPKEKEKDEDTKQRETKTKKRKKGKIRCKETLTIKKKDDSTKQEDPNEEKTKTVHYDREEYNDNAEVMNEKCKSERFLERLNLRQYYPNKLKLMDVMALRDSTNPLEIESIALQVAMKIIMINFTARDELLLQLTARLQEENTKPTFDSLSDDFLCCVDDDDSITINPLDLLFTIFKCSSPMLQQVLTVKLFICKLAIPFVHPPFDKEPDLLTLWPLRSILIECKTEKESLDYNSVDCPCHVVSFLRLGRPSVSKSKVMNEIISDQYHNTFFNKDCSLGTSNRAVSEGMVEASWYLPSTSGSVFDNVIMFLNLRGDGKKWLACSHNLAQISNVVVVLLHIDELTEDSCNEFLGSLVTKNSTICLAVDAGMYKGQEIKRKVGSYFQQFKDFKHQPKAIIVAMNGQMRSISAVKTELRKTISALANESELKDLRLSERVHKHYKGNIDEHKKIYVNAEHAARNVIGHIESLQTNVKRKVVPLQGKTWQTWSEKMKRSNKTSLYKTLEEQGKLQNDMHEERRKQAEMCSKLSPAMFWFVKYLRQFAKSEDDGIVFILYLKQMLDERSRNILPRYLLDFQTCWQELKLARDNNENTDKIKKLRKKLDESEYRLAEASFGFEHFCREMGQIYLSLKEFPPLDKQMDQIRSRLPSMTVNLLLMGLPFEIMDGDVANVPLEWVSVVFKTLKETIGDKKLLTLSVLGIQSSGKSTLLNTMFGLQFAVSAGRCTRGVFMQLVPVKKKKSAFDYLLVIDTEGLRAPELAIQKHSHDNELATFVIGLSDITIVNIKGENTAEMKDVLQIAVHASLRLSLANKNLNLRQSCVFVHQNVPAFDANDKMIQGRQKFVEELDMMTKESADQINIAEIQSFNQVIEFDSEKDVWYFSDLWRGDLPMAPANPGYSDSVAKVKENIVANIYTTRFSYLTITDTISRINDLWNGIVKDDFVFSFRNSLEMKAHASLEQICQTFLWKLEQYVLEFGLTKVKSRFVGCKDQHELYTAVEELNINLQIAVKSEVEKQIKELDAFIEQNTLKDIMIQWIQGKRKRLSENAETLIWNARKNIGNTVDEIIVKLKTTKEKTRHEMEINEMAKSLAIKMQGQKPDKQELKRRFNDLWCSWIKTIPTTKITDAPIELQIKSTICKRFMSDATFIEKQKPFSDQMYFRMKKLESSLNETHLTNEHISIHKKLGVWSKDKIENCNRHTVDVMNTIFRKIDNKISHLSAEDIQFDILYITEILNIVVTGIEEHNKHENNDYKFNLLPPFRAMVINHVASYATVFFTNKNNEYINKHSPKAQMEKYRGTAWILFKSTVQNKTDDFIAVGLFREAMMKGLADHIDNLIPIDVSDHIFKHFGDGKNGLIIEILTELANEENFDNYFKFIKDPNSYAENWLTTLSQKKLFETAINEQTTYAFLVEARALKLFEGIQKCIDSSSKGFHGNISDWIDKFVSEVNATDNLPLSVGMFVHVKNTPVTDVQAFIDLLNGQMTGTKDELLCPYRNTTWSSVKWTKNPIPRIMKRLWGCTDFCMFCHEPCKEMNPDHWELDKQPHRCVQHRPSGLSGFRNSETQVMTIRFCNFNVASDRQYEMAELSGPYKDYRNHFPSWDILPNANASDYWKWVTCNFKKAFLDKYEINEPDIPENWWLITKQKAIESLFTLS